MRAIIVNYPTDQKIYAIKAVRHALDLGLKEAKEIIDNIPAEIDANSYQIKLLRDQGIVVDTEELDRYLTMRKLVDTFLAEGKYKAAQYVIDAMEELDE